MTPEEKAAADKAAAEKAAAEAEKNKVDPHIHALNEENKKHRLRGDALEKELTETKANLQQFKDGFKSALGIKDDNIPPEKLKEAVAQKESQMRTILLETKIESAATKAGLKDPSDALRLLELNDIKVDVEKRTVDTAAIDKALESLKEKKPYLFEVEEGTPKEKKPGTPSKTPGKKPIAEHTPGDELTHYKLLLKTDKGAAVEFLNKYRKEIGEQTLQKSG